MYKLSMFALPFADAGSNLLFGVVFSLYLSVRDQDALQPTRRKVCAHEEEWCRY